MTIVIGIFKDQYKNNRHLTIVKPGLQILRFNHVSDTVQARYLVFKLYNNSHYSISYKKSFSTLKVAKMSSNKVKFLSKRLVKDLHQF